MKEHFKFEHQQRISPWLSSSNKSQNLTDVCFLYYTE
uniref:Uncharacterized protein n=1 Tax=Sus scrofa TaxID=9823 RepID=A0A4X1W4I6_PIG